jgi:hypothetical protein
VPFSVTASVARWVQRLFEGRDQVLAFSSTRAPVQLLCGCTRAKPRRRPVRLGPCVFRLTRLSRRGPVRRRVCNAAAIPATHRLAVTRTRRVDVRGLGWPLNSSGHRRRQNLRDDLALLLGTPRTRAFLHHSRTASFWADSQASRAPRRLGRLRTRDRRGADAQKPSIYAGLGLEPRS